MKSIRNILPASILLAGLLLLPSCAQNQEKEQPNIVWITSEDNSSHFLKLYDEHGAAAPSIEFLASHGLQFTNAFSNAPVCSVARSTLISSCYAPRIGAQYHRKAQRVPEPEGLRMFPAYLRDAGYFTTNNAKEDYNIIKTDDVWDISSKKATWKKRAEGQPFFHVQNIGTTHESRLHFTAEQMAKQATKTNPDSVFIPPYHPNTDLFRYTYARYHDRIMEMDTQLGKIIEDLRKDDLLDETFIFYYGDHGGVLPGSKGYLKEAGLKVPFVVYVPEKYKHMVREAPGSEMNGFVSFIDFGATVLQLAGVEVPEDMDGKPFLGPGIKSKDVEKRDETYSYADRFDEKYDLVRALRVGKYKYIRNYQPFNMDGLQNNYRYRMLAYQEWRELYEKGELNDAQSAFFRTKAVEELYNLEADPYEVNNLAGESDHAEILEKMRSRLREKITDMPDLSFFPEHYFLREGLQNPVQFGVEHKGEIAELLSIADLQLLPFEDAKEQIELTLHSDNANKRYWALNVCSTFGEEAEEFIPQLEKISQTDPELINKVRAAEYLAIFGNTDPAPVINEALASSSDLSESWLILNTVSLLKDLKSPYAFTIDKSLFPESFLDDGNIKQRLTYINKIASE